MAANCTRRPVYRPRHSRNFLSIGTRTWAGNGPPRARTALFRLIVPSSAGNSPQRTRGREAADRSKLPLAGQMSRTLGRARIFTQRQGRANWAGWAPGMERLLRTQGAHFFSVRSERLDRGAGCPNWARPDLWEPRVSNHPRPTGTHGCSECPLLTRLRTPAGEVPVSASGRIESLVGLRSSGCTASNCGQSERRPGAPAVGRAACRFAGGEEIGRTQIIAVVADPRDVARTNSLSAKAIGPAR